MTDLKFLPCMCCGSDRIIHFKTSKNRGYATCIDCGMRTRGCGNYENKDDLKWKDRATILWNRRTPMAKVILCGSEVFKCIRLGVKKKKEY